MAITENPEAQKNRITSTIELFTPFEETVETVQQGANPGAAASLNYSNLIDLPSIKVTFNGVEYTCKGDINNAGILYGTHANYKNPFVDYPFSVVSLFTGNNTFVTETAGTYTVRIEPSDESIKLADVIANGQSVNAALMRLALAFGVFPDLSDSNAVLIDKICMGVKLYKEEHIGE